MYSARYDNPESVGILSQQWIRCGKPNCRCRHGRPHGPYFYLHYRQWEQARGWVHRRRYVRREDAPAVARQIAKNKLQDRAMSNMWGRARRLRRGMLNVAAWLHGPGGQQEPDKNLMPRVDVSRVKPPPAPPWRARGFHHEDCQEAAKKKQHSPQRHEDTKREAEEKKRPGRRDQLLPLEGGGPAEGRGEGDAAGGQGAIRAKARSRTPSPCPLPSRERGEETPRRRVLREGAWAALRKIAEGLTLPPGQAAGAKNKPDSADP